MTDQSAKMPEEIYLIKNPEMEEDEDSHIIWSTAPDIYDKQQVVGKYTRTTVEPKVLDDAATADDFPVAHISDLTKLVMRLCYKIKEPCKLKEQALDYIKRYGLPTGSVLRDDLATLKKSLIDATQTITDLTNERVALWGQIDALKKADDGEMEAVSYHNMGERFTVLPEMHSKQPIVNDGALAEAIKYFKDDEYRETIDGTLDYLHFEERLDVLISHASKNGVVEVTEIEFVRIIDGLESFSSAAELFEHLEKNGIKVVKIIDGGK